MKILITSPTYPPFNSGLGNAVSQQAAILAGAGHEVVIATGGTHRNTRKDLHSAISIEEFAVAGADSLLNPIRGEVTSYVAFLRDSNFDAVLMNAWQNWATDLVFRHIRDVRGRKFLYSHCISTNVFFSHQLVRSTLRYLAWRPYWWDLARRMRALDGIIFLAGKGMDSRFDDLNVARAIGVTTYIVPNGLSDSALNVLSNPAWEMADRNQLIAVGSYQWQKGFDFVLKAYAASAVKNCIPLKLYGQQHSPYTETLRAMADNLYIDRDFVSFNDGISGDKLLEEYSKSTLFLSGSYTECQPLVLLDANAAGTPFIARATGCINKMPGGCSVKTVAEMASEINRLTSNPVQWGQCSNAGRVAALQIYHPDRIGRLLTDIVENGGCCVPSTTIQ